MTASLLNTAAFFRDLNREPTLITHGQGVYLYDKQGKAYIDGASGAAVACLGHGRHEIAAYMAEQAAKLSFAHVSKFASEPMVRLAQELAERAPDGIDRVFFTSGGSESNEAAMKLARQYHLARGNISKYKVITRRTSYHGTTLGALALSGQVGRRQLFAPMLQGMPMVAPTSCYRCPFGQERGSCDVACAKDLETALLNEGPENIAAFIAEPVVGSSAPGRTAPSEYWQRIRAICDAYDILFIADEVMSGNGRSGHWWAMQHFGARPDIITTAKGIGAGYTPLGAVLVSEMVYQQMVSVPGNFRHGHTYSGNPVSCAVGSKVIEIIERENLLQNVMQMGERLKTKLYEAFSTHPYVGLVRGTGLLLGIEFVEDKERKRPFDPTLNIKTRFSHACLDRGLYIYQGGGSVDGVQGDHALIAPPFIITAEQVDEMVQIMADALEGVVTQLKLTPPPKAAYPMYTE